MSDDKTARIIELEEQLRERNASIRRLDEWTHKQNLAVAEWAKKLADRDAAWERAIEGWWNKGQWASDSKDFLAAVREILEAEGGGA